MIKFYRIYSVLSVIVYLISTAQFIIPELSHAQRLSFRNYSVKEGLIQSQITSIVQDHKGYIWFGTAEGLTCFNGKNFKHHSKKHGLASTYINTILIDSRGDFWLGHRAMGISKYIFKEKRFEKVALPKQYKSVTILDIIEDKSGSLWFATENKGLLKLENDTWTIFNQETGLPTTQLLGMTLGNHNLWIGTREGLFVYNINDPEESKFTKLGAKYGLSSQMISALFTDRQNNIWLGDTKSGIIKFTPSGDNIGDGTFINISQLAGLPSVHVMEFYQDTRGKYWIGTRGDGIIRYNPPNDTEKNGSYFHINKRNGLMHETVTAVFQDREGVYWFGTDGGGVYQYIDSAFEQYGKPEGLQGEFVWAIFEDQRNGLWFGTESGLTHFPKNIGGPVHYYNGKDWQGDDMVIDIEEDRLGRIWICIHGYGPRIFDRNKKTFHSIPDLEKKYVITMDQDEEGNIWFGTFYNGVFKFDLETEHVINYKSEDGLASNTVFKIELSHNGNLWFATNGSGITRFDGSNFKNYSVNEGLSALSILSLAEDAHHNLWIGAEGDGLFKFDGKSFENYSQKYDIWDEDIYSLMDDNENNIWIGTRRGIERLNPETGQVKKYGEFEGFSGVETNQDAVFKDDEGCLWFGTIEGAIRYNPQVDKKNPVPPLNYIDNVRVYFKDHPLPDDGEYAYNDNFLTFSYSGLSYIAPEKVRYSYMLEGLDKEWSPLTEERTATYVNLSPGDYIFKVKAINSGSIWSEQPAIYTFSIATPFWLKGWFFLIMLSLIGFIAYAVHNYRVRRIQRNNLQLEKMVHARTKDLVIEKEKTQKAYDALLESENKLRQVTSSVNAFLWSAEVSEDKKIDYIFMTDAFKDICGHDLNKPPKNKTQFEYLLSIIHPEDRGMLQNSLKSVLHGEKINIIYRIIAKDGHIRWVYDNAIPKKNNQGQVRFIHGVGFDATDRKKAEEALKKSEEKYETFVRYSTEAIWCIDLNTPISTELPADEQVHHIMNDAYLSDCNDAMAEMYGYQSSSEIIGFPLSAGLLRDSKENRKHIKKFVETEYRLKNAEFQELDRKGEIRIILASFVGIVDNGNFVRAWGMQQDVTSKRKAEQALRESEEIYRKLIERSPDTIVVHSDQQIDYINDAGLKLFGAKNRKEIIGKPLLELTCLEYQDICTKQMNKISDERKEIGVIEQKMRKLDGDEFDVEIMGAPIIYKGKNSGQFIIRDITEKKRLEEELQKAQKLESVGILAGGIAHDFNNILTAILGNISLGKLYSSQDSNTSSVLSEAEKATLHAKDLTHQLLTFSKGGAPVKETTSIYDIVKESAGFVLRGSKIECEYQSADDLWAVEVDAAQISQVIQNLIINAEQAMPDGKKIMIKFENMAIQKRFLPGVKPGDFVRITISDDGIGISEEHLSKIFDPYFTTKQKGSGLGLATCYSIIKRHSGHIQVKSEIGIGTDVVIHLPTSKKQLLKEQKVIEVLESGKGRILVMDDEEMLRDLSKQFLSHLGYEVETVPDGETAVKTYINAQKENIPFALVIMDLTIPGGMGGKEAILELQKVDPAVKAIVSSGYSNDPVLANHEQYGFKAVLAKPYKIETLSNIITSVINGKREKIVSA